MKKVDNPVPSAYESHLYFAGPSLRTNPAINNLKKLCSERLPGRCTLKYFNLYENPGLARDAQITPRRRWSKKSSPGIGDRVM